MVYFKFTLKLAVFIFLCASCSPVNGQQIDSVTYEGQLKIGKRESTIYYLGEETGDLAAFCFTNKSAIGRAILAKCKNGERCKFSGRVDWSKFCKVSGNLSAQAKIVSLKSISKVVRKRRT